MTCAVTGANGYLGSRVARHFVDAGCSVVRLVSPRSDHSQGLVLPLGPEVPSGFFRERKIDVLVHCAYDFSLTRWNDIRAINVDGSRRLLDTAIQDGVGRIVVVSTLSAYSGCRSLYGKAKLMIEGHALAMGAVVVRPGLIYGDRPGGIVGKMLAWMRALPVVPLIGSGKQVLFPAREDDVVEAVARLCRKNGSPPVAHVPLAEERGFELREILQLLASRMGRRPILVPVPWRLLWAGLKGMETAGIPIPLRSDSVLSLAYQNASPDFNLTKSLGLTFRSLCGGLE